MHTCFFNLLAKLEEFNTDMGLSYLAIAGLHSASRKF